MAAVQVDPVAKQVRFPVRDVLERRHIGIIDLLTHFTFSLFVFL